MTLHEFMADIKRRYENLAAGRQADGAVPPRGPALSKVQRALCASFAHDLDFMLRKYPESK